MHGALKDERKTRKPSDTVSEGGNRVVEDVRAVSSFKPIDLKFSPER